jgi:hypothetical protein
MAWLVAVIAIVLMAGCGGSDHATSQTNRERAESERHGGEAENEAEEKDRALSSIARTDRIAFVQIGVAAGALRTAASLAEVKHVVRRRDTVVFQKLRPRVRSLQPRNRLLVQLRDQLMVDLDRAIEAGRSVQLARRSAKGTLARVDRILRGLNRYAVSHPGTQALVPD